MGALSAVSCSRSLTLMLHNDPNFCTLGQVEYSDQLICRPRCHYLAPNNHLPDAAIVGVVGKGLAQCYLAILKDKSVVTAFSSFFIPLTNNIGRHCLFYSSYQCLFIERTLVGSISVLLFYLTVIKGASAITTRCLSAHRGTWRDWVWSGQTSGEGLWVTFLINLCPYLLLGHLIAQDELLIGAHDDLHLPPHAVSLPRGPLLRGIYNTTFPRPSSQDKYRLSNGVWYLSSMHGGIMSVVYDLCLSCGDLVLPFLILMSLLVKF